MIIWLAWMMFKVSMWFVSIFLLYILLWPLLVFLIIAFDLNQ